MNSKLDPMNIGAEQGMEREALVVTQHQIAATYFQLTIHAPQICATARAGQFVHLLPRPKGLQSDPLLRRAFSIASVDGPNFNIIYRAGGRGTKAMSQWEAGDIVDILGPLGHAFAPLGRSSLLVGGGVGVPPLAFLAAQRNPVTQSAIALLGARSEADVLCREEFSQSATPYEIATDDGSVGHHGFVIDLLNKHLEEACRNLDRGRSNAYIEHSDAAALQVFACGPLPMLNAVAQSCAHFRIPCQVSLEEAMPCGVGVCNGCVVPVLNSPIIAAGQDEEQLTREEYSRYRRLCIDGPMLWAHEVDWPSLMTNLG